jgi:hypothetical protein
MSATHEKLAWQAQRAGYEPPLMALIADRDR